MGNFKAKTNNITRFVLTHIGMAVFGLIMFGVTNQMGNSTMLAASIGSAGFYAVLVYTSMWEIGAADKPGIDAGRISGYRATGFLIEAVALSPYILIVLVYGVSALMSGSETADSIVAICYTVLVLIGSCFDGIMLSVAPRGENYPVVAAVYILGAVFIICVAGIAYLAGTKEFKIIPSQKNNKR